MLVNVYKKSANIIRYIKIAQIIMDIYVVYCNKIQSVQRYVFGLKLYILIEYNEHSFQKR
jgi:hypothetical protein